LAGDSVYCFCFPENAAPRIAHFVDAVVKMEGLLARITPIAKSSAKMGRWKMGDGIDRSFALNQKH